MEPGFDGGTRHYGERRRLLAGGGIGISRSLELQVSTVAAANTGSGIVNINNSGPLVIGTVNGVAGIMATRDVAINDIGWKPAV